MKINYNVSAAITNKHLLGIENNLSKSMERLSSGLKLNHAKDNPAGMAISNKMRAQINGLDRASQNASDGISVIQIADGALNETISMLQRMRELSIQAANGTNSISEKEAIQVEIESLKDEIDRISSDTEYNAKPLLDGTLDTRVYTEHASRVNISDYVPAGDYELKIEQAATQATVQTSGVDYHSTQVVGVSGRISINGSIADIIQTDTYAEAYEKIREAAEIGEMSATRDTGALVLTSNTYGKNSVAKITFDNEDLAASLGFVPDGDYSVIKVEGEGDEEDEFVYGKEENGIILSPAGTDPVISKDAADWIGFSDSATIAFDGNKITITDMDGFSMTFLADAGYAEGVPEVDTSGAPTGVIYDGKLKFEVTDMGTMTLHIGANMDQNMEVRIPEVSCESLYIDDLDVTTINGADRAMVQLDYAISQVSAVRSRLGAYENRLEHSTASLDAFEENMTSAFSRLTDVDMADEMTTYTQQNVLNQAAISVLSQANEIPQQVLQILQ